MTMGLPCDSDGYDLRMEQCRQCGSRGCPKRHRCKDADERFPKGWLSELPANAELTQETK